MKPPPLWPYQCPVTHEAVSAILRQRSTNRTDIRDVALRDVDLSSARNILDLGCGFGFMGEALADRVAPDATFVGVDAWPANEGPFLQKVTTNGRTGRFVCMRLESKLPWPDKSFDLVVCSYSLYFFVDVIPEVARVLAPHGRFLTLTHSEYRVADLLADAGLVEAASTLVSLTRKFSAENGCDLLRPWFGEVVRIDYENALRFESEHLDELLLYLRFKLPLLVPGSRTGDELPDGLVRLAKNLLSATGAVIVEKNDAVFQCRSPLCR